MFAMIERIHGDGVTVLMVEQNVALALEVATRAYVLEEGRSWRATRPKRFVSSRTSGGHTLE